MPPKTPDLQPGLFDGQEPTPVKDEVNILVWASLEKVISPQVKKREEGLDEIIEMEILWTSKLAAYVLATRLDDQNLAFRTNVVQALGPLLLQGNNKKVEAGVVSTLRNYLSQMRRRRIFALVQVGEELPAAQPNVAVLLRACSFAGKDLGDIFSNRRLPMGVREQAIQVAGIAGFLETVPRLERLAARLEGWLSGQKPMSFIDQTNSEETVLLPSIKETLSTLNSR